jgi:hypothetical protein
MGLLPEMGMVLLHWIEAIFFGKGVMVLRKRSCFGGVRRPDLARSDPGNFNSAVTGIWVHFGYTSPEMQLETVLQAKLRKSAGLFFRLNCDWFCGRKAAEYFLAPRNRLGAGGRFQRNRKDERPQRTKIWVGAVRRRVESLF